MCEVALEGTAQKRLVCQRLAGRVGMGEAIEAATPMPGAVESGGYRVNLRRQAFDRPARTPSLAGFRSGKCAEAPTLCR